ncbi:MAG: carboxypeptidase-like regulatory domain-containing protein [Prolixibacteraceae bacterium]|nr:carboxypeptidase-like regulatory domain-containing protein [Prolixibacteraceae bacterium]
MSGKQTYQQEEQIRRYLLDRMTDAERHAFEREMQRDPFLEEAVDGLSAFSSDNILSDIQTLKAEVQKGKHSNRRYIWYAAASVLVIVISTFILFNLEEKTNQTLTENIQEVETKVQAEIAPQPQNQEQIEPEHKKVQEATFNTKSVHSPNLAEQMEMEKIDRQQTVTQQITNRESLLEESSNINVRQVKEVAAIPENLETSKKSLDKNTNFSKTVSGVVTDSSGRPLPGASVLVKRTTKGTITDQNGKYFVSDVPDSSSLVFSFIGMKPQEIPLENKVQMDVALKEDNAALSEVVVVGYGIQKKSSLTGAVSSVKSKQVIDGKATPVGGWEAFNEYLKTELQSPNIGSPSEKKIVKLSFVVSSTGNKEKFEILKGENDRYNKEAIRIITDGPAWTPEIKSGNPEISVVELRLVFQSVVK